MLFLELKPVLGRDRFERGYGEEDHAAGKDIRGNFSIPPLTSSDVGLHYPGRDNR